MEGKGHRQRRVRPATRRESHALLRAETWEGRFKGLAASLREPRHLLWGGVVVALFFTSVPLLRYCLDHRYFAVREVQVVGARRLSAAVVEGWLGVVEEGRSIWRVDRDALAARLRARPEIAAARVERELPGRLRVTIEEREGAALLHAGHRFHLVAADGSVLGQVAEPDPALPIVTLAGPADREPALPRPSELEHVLELAREIDGGAAGLPISEVALDAAGREPRVTLFSEDGRLRIELGWRGFPGKLALLRRIVREAALDAADDSSTPARRGSVALLDGRTAVVRWAKPAPPGKTARRAA